MDATETLLTEIARTWPRIECCQRAQLAGMIEVDGAERERTAVLIRGPGLAYVVAQQVWYHLRARVRATQTRQGIVLYLPSSLNHIGRGGPTVGAPQPLCDQKAALRGELAAVGKLYLGSGVKAGPRCRRWKARVPAGKDPDLQLLRFTELPRTAARWALRPGVPLSHPRRGAEFALANLDRTNAAARELVPLLKVFLDCCGSELAPHLRESAQLRVEHPLLSLSALGALARPPQSKDSFAGRLRRAVQAAKQHQVTDCGARSLP